MFIYYQKLNYSSLYSFLLPFCVRTSCCSLISLDPLKPIEPSSILITQVFTVLVKTYTIPLRLVNVINCFIQRHNTDIVYGLRSFKFSNVAVHVVLMIENVRLFGLNCAQSDRFVILNGFLKSCFNTFSFEITHEMILHV